MRNIVFQALLLFLVLFYSKSCLPVNSDSSGFKVEYHGALRDMMRKGDITAKVDLEVFDTVKHFYALGAMENLKGEIQIFDGQPYNTIVIGDSLSVDTSFGKKATLLVHASVKSWSKHLIPDAISTHEQLEDFIERSARATQINVNKPFPFLIEGNARTIDWHVIDWKEGDTEHTHEKHISSGLSGSLENREVEILGFYSNSHHAVFTHHTTNMHMHVKTTDGEIAGHVDDIVPGNGIILKLPEL